MASGRKNYFRHSFNAFEDAKIQKAIDLLGYEGYAFFFILIEILAKQCEHSFQNPITIHQQSLRNVWRKQTKSCKKVVEKLQESGLFVATFKESFIEFDIPNLAKYLGKYENKNPPNVPNKRKEKEIKVNKIKEKESKVKESPLAHLFDDEKIITWLKDGDAKIQLKILETYQQDFIIQEVLKAHNWKIEKKKNRKASDFLKAWFERGAKDKDFLISETDDAFDKLFNGGN